MRTPFASLAAIVATAATGAVAAVALAQPAPPASPPPASSTNDATPQASSSAAPLAPPPLRRKAVDPTEVEIVNLSEEDDRDPQFLAVGGQVGGGWMTNRGSKGAAFADFALTVDVGLGPRGARVPWTLQPYFAVAVTFGSDLGVGVSPNRFTELGVRAVYRFSGALEGSWASLGGGLVWTSTKPSSGFAGAALCRRDVAAAEAQGLSCDVPGDISPGGLVDLGFGVREWTSRRARWGFGARVPIQISSHPGAGIVGFFYAQLGTGL